MTTANRMIFEKRSSSVATRFVTSASSSMPVSAETDGGRMTRTRTRWTIGPEKRRRRSSRTVQKMTTMAWLEIQSMAA